MITSMTDFQREVLDSKDPVLVDFYADWCGPCKSLDTVLGTIKDTRVVKVNVNKANDVAGAFMIQTVPTTIMFSSGKVTGVIEGLRPRERYIELIGGGCL